jgi:hypothetical protein
MKAGALPVSELKWVTTGPELLYVVIVASGYFEVAKPMATLGLRIVF